MGGVPGGIRSRGCLTAAQRTTYIATPLPKVIDHVADQQRLDADPNLDTTFYFYADPNPDRNRNQAGCG